MATTTATTHHLRLRPSRGGPRCDYDAPVEQISWAPTRRHRGGRPSRDYDPTTGTFTTRDPLDGVDGTPTVANPYHYVDNDPLNKIDPLGLRATDADFPGSAIGIQCRLEPDIAGQSASGPAPTRNQYLASRPERISCFGPGIEKFSSDPQGGGILVPAIPRAGDGSDCGKVANCLMWRIIDLAKRNAEIRFNPLNQPLRGPSMTVESHQKHYENQRNDLQKVIDYANAHNCWKVDAKVNLLLEVAQEWAAYPTPAPDPQQQQQSQRYSFQFDPRSASIPISNSQAAAMSVTVVVVAAVVILVLIPGPQPI